MPFAFTHVLQDVDGKLAVIPAPLLPDESILRAACTRSAPEGGGPAAATLPLPLFSPPCAHRPRAGYYVPSMRPTLKHYIATIPAKHLQQCCTRTLRLGEVFWFHAAQHRMKNMCLADSDSCNQTAHAGVLL
jgi:hypothetical protein